MADSGDFAKVPAKPMSRVEAFHESIERVLCLSYNVHARSKSIADNFSGESDCGKSVAPSQNGPGILGTWQVRMNDLESVLNDIMDNLNRIDC